MLIEKRSAPSINDIVSLKLVSGDEIVGKFVEQTAESIVIAKPLTAVVQPVSQTQMGLSFLPVLASVEPDVTLSIPLASISVRPVKSSQHVTANYIKMTSGLITPGAGPSSIFT